MEYAHGLEHEIYCIKIPNVYVGLQFQFFVSKKYIYNGILILGIRRKKPKCFFDLHEILINPIDYHIMPGD